MDGVCQTDGDEGETISLDSGAEFTGGLVDQDGIGVDGDDSGVRGTEVEGGVLAGVVTEVEDAVAGEVTEL